MTNNNVFKTNPGNVKDADVMNEAGGKAYALSDKAALTQYAMTGTFHGTFYSTDIEQLNRVLELANKCDIEFVAKLAVYARRKGLMKDSPAVLAAVVASKNPALLKKIFPLVINDPKMLRNFVQIMRSGVVGRKSLGSAPKKLIQKFLNNLTDEQLFKADVGNNPSLQDIIKMVHPKAATPARNALYGYLLSKKHDETVLLPLAKQYEAFKKDLSSDIPNVPFLMLTALALTDDHYKTLAQKASWNQIRQNLNNFTRHNVFTDPNVENAIATKLSNPDEVRKANAFPYQLYSTYINTEANVSAKIKMALQTASEISLENVPVIDGDLIIAVDTSGSMNDPVTGKRINPKTGKEESFTSKMRCTDVAAMITAAILRKNPLTKIVPFDLKVKEVNLNPMDSVMTNAKKLALAGGGTDCGCALAHMNEHNMKARAVIYVSDNQSWRQSTETRANETSMMREWTSFQKRNPKAKLINIDITPYNTVQVYDSNAVLNVGGFSDQVFEVISNFLNDGGSDVVIKTIEGINLDG